MTVNIFVSGSGGNWYDNPQWGNFFNGAHGIPLDTKTLNVVESRQDGRAKMMVRGSLKKNYIVTFRNCFYVQQELENIGYQLANAITFIQSDSGQREVNLFGHSNGGNAIVRYLQAFRHDFVHDVVTCATPYNGEAWSVNKTGFLKEVENVPLHISGTISMFVGSMGNNDGNSAYPKWLDTDGTISTDSGSCGVYPYGKQVTVISQRDHGTILNAPQVQNAVQSWFK